MKQKNSSEWTNGAGAVFGCFIGMGLGVHALPLYGQALFVTPLQAEFGWSRLDITFTATIVVILLAFVVPFAGILADKFSISKLITTSAVCMAGCFLALANINSSISSLYIPMAVMAVSGAACSTLSFSRIISAYFKEHRGKALGLAMAGNGFASFLTPLFLGPFIAEHGWRAGYYALAAVMLIGAVVLAILIKMPSSDTAYRSNSEETVTGIGFYEALAIPHSWLLAAIFFLIPLAIGGFITHMVAMLTDAGFTPTETAKQVSGIGIAMMIARLSTGYLIDRFFAPFIGTILMALAAGGLIVMAFGGVNYAFFGALATGLAIGAEIDLIGFLTSKYYGLRSFGKIYGVLYGFLMCGTALSPVGFALIQAHYGSYFPALVISSVVMAVAAILFLFLPRYSDGNLDGSNK
ncbi:MFS transporter [Azospirillum sp. 412522]|nr:MFS transporter [Azospirillum sp. 412522]MBY6264412.1 MFS transporter [Azospirillum sp. 412522]